MKTCSGWIRGFFGSRCSVPLMFALGAAVFLPCAARTQAIPTATKSGSIQAGVGAMYLDNDFTDRSNKGLSFWGDYDFLHYKGLRVGAELEAHLGGIITPDDIGENSYLAGGRVSFYRRYHLDAYGKFMGGRATITNQDTNAASSFNVYAFGGGIDYRVAHRINIRAVDFELQKWPNFEPHTLSPYAISVGVMYIIR